MLCLRLRFLRVRQQPMPGMARTIHGDHKRYIDTYWGVYPGHYFTGDGARRDEDGDYWITGRVDDVINVSGHRMGTAEVSSVCVDVCISVCVCVYVCVCVCVCVRVCVCV